MSEKRWALMSRKVIGRPDNPMVIRWRLLQTPWFGIYLHFIHREDLDRLPHDHPWSFWTWIVRGSYDEEFFADTRRIRVGDSCVTRQTRPRWSVRRFPAMAAHRITAVRGNVTTLVLVGRKFRTWGFYDGAGRFIDWRDYHDSPNGWNEEQERLRTEHVGARRSDGSTVKPGDPIRIRQAFVEYERSDRLGPGGRIEQDGDLAVRADGTYPQMRPREV